MLKRTTILIISFLTFIGLGASAALLGVLYPFVRDTYNLPLDAVGAVLLSSSVGFIGMSFFSGRLAEKIGYGLFIVGGNVFMALGLLVHGLSGNWWVFVAGGLLRGAGAGILDSGLNGFAAAHFDERTMNWLHASFAAGATVAPLWITFLLNSGFTWRWGFGSVALMPAFLTLLVLATLRHWQTDTDTDTNPKIPSATIAQTLRLPTVWLGIIIFAVYAGAEGTMGQWAFSLFNEGRGVLAATAGIWVSFYWGGLLVGRMLVPLLMVRWGIKGVMRLCLVGSILVSVLIWLNLSATLDFIALTLMGFFFAPIFPTLMSATPGRVGQKYAGNTIGFQVAAADIGIAGFPALAGILASTTSLEAIPPFIALTCLIMWGLYEIMRR